MGYAAAKVLQGQKDAARQLALRVISPELRIQTSKAGVTRLDAILLTHDHADQVHGLDDVRAFALRQRARLACWMDAATTETLHRRFGYIFKAYRKTERTLLSTLSGSIRRHRARS